MGWPPTGLMECGCDSRCSVSCLQSTVYTTILAADWLISIRILRYCALVQLLLAWLYLPNTLTAGAKYARDMSHDSETVH